MMDTLAFLPPHSSFFTHSHFYEHLLTYFALISHLPNIQWSLMLEFFLQLGAHDLARLIMTIVCHTRYPSCELLGEGFFFRVHDNIMISIDRGDERISWLFSKVKSVAHWMRCTLDTTRCAVFTLELRKENWQRFLKREKGHRFSHECKSSQYWD
jgi:hypothetical protein